MNGRGILALGVLAAWGAGVAAYAQREMSRSPRERLAELAARVAPGATYFAVHQGGRHVGFASNTIDTIPGGLQVTDYLVADLRDGTTTRRTTAQSVVHLSRALGLRDFTIAFGRDSQSVRATGRTVGDSLLETVVSYAGRPADTTRVHLAGPLLLPTLVPMAVMLGDPPKVGRRLSINTFDPLTLSASLMPVRIAAESLFVLVDSAAYHPVSRRWLGAHADTVRGFRLIAEPSERFDAWVDEQGRIIAVAAPAGLSLARTAYEVAFENWRTASPRHAGERVNPDDGGRHGAASAGGSREGRPVQRLRVRLRGIDLGRLAIDGGAQQLRGDTVSIERDATRTADVWVWLPLSQSLRRHYASELREEPLLEIEHPAIVALARQLGGGGTIAEPILQRMVSWVRDSLANESSVTLSSALTTLRSRRGDSNEHAQLFVALARAAGIPARTVSGMVVLNGRPYYHAWAEVLLQRWVGVDPTFGQFPVDASHLRMLVGGLSMETELTRLIGRLQVDVLTQSTASPSHDD